MNVPMTKPEKAWAAVLGQLQHEMPKAAFETWVRDTKFVSFEEGLFTVGVANDYAREWLTSRLTSTVVRLLTGILNQNVDVAFIVYNEYFVEEEIENDEENKESIGSSLDNPDELSLQAEFKSIYDEIVQPDRVIVFRGYFLRFLPFLGFELAWMYIGFRQAAYEAGAGNMPMKQIFAPAKKIAAYAGMSLRTFRRWTAKPETWQRLQGLVEPIKSEPRWRRGKDGHPHQSPKEYKITMSLPLTPADEVSLRAWLQEKLAQGMSPLSVLQQALETPVDELIPWSSDSSVQEIPKELHTIQDLVTDVCGLQDNPKNPVIATLADDLVRHIMPPRDLVFLTHYFVLNWLPKLGSGPSWFVTLLRDRGYINHRTGEIRDKVRFEDGYFEIANRLGLSRVKTVWEWLRKDELAIFTQEAGKGDGDWETSARFIQVCLGEPLTPEDEQRARDVLIPRSSGGVDTHREVSTGLPIGASDTHNGVDDTHTEQKSISPVGGFDTHTDAIDTHGVGAIDSPSGEDDTHKVGASDTPIGALDISSWREWHRLNTLSLVSKHRSNSSNTTTTTDGEDTSDRESRIEDAVVAGLQWDLVGLLNHNRVNNRNIETLTKNSVSATDFISWLVYAASPQGNGIHNPVGHAISRMIREPHRGAGAEYEQLASLTPEELEDLIHRELNLQNPSDKTWKKTMEGTTHKKLVQLAEQLGVSIPRSCDW